MAKAFKMQVATDITNLVLLLAKLGFTCGVIKAASMTTEGRINIWFVPGTSATVKRVQAQLLRGEKTTFGDSPRRVYTDLKVQFTSAERFAIVEDSDYLDHGLETPMDYGFFQNHNVGDCWAEPA